VRVRILIASIFIIHLLPTLAQEEFTLESADCSIRLKSASSVNSKVDENIQEEINELQELASEKLEKRKFVIHPFIQNKRVLAGELYFDWNRSFTQESIYNSCVISIAVKKAKGQIPLDSDPVLFQKAVRRRVPRITFRGMERCKLAMKECFISIPTCKKIGHNNEKQ